jgi:GNAT superfamily N-acetyltransferase
MAIATATAGRADSAGNTKSTTGFEFRRLRMAELPLLNDLYNAYYGAERPLEEAVWLYANNPCGTGVIFAAFDMTGRLAGMRPSIPFRLWWGGEERMGYELADALVDPRHQGKGIFSRLVTMTCDWAQQEGHVVFTLPNENSLAVYARNPSLRVLGQSHTRAKPLSWIPYLRHQLKRRHERASRASYPVEAHPLVSERELLLRPIDRFQSDFADVRAELQARLSGFTLRTPEFLQWRYFGSPIRKYYVSLVEEHGRVRGYVAIRMVAGIAHIVDVFLPPDTGLARRVFRLAARSARRMGAIGVHVNTAGNELFLTAAASSGFWLKKASCPLVVDSASARRIAQFKQRPASLGDVYFTTGDFDFL